MLKNKKKILFTKEKKFDSKLNQILISREINDFEISKSVSEIINEIKEYQDKALLTMIKNYDNIYADNIKNLKIGYNLLKKAFQNLPLDLQNSLKMASKRIKSFHEKQMVEGFEYNDNLDVVLGLKYDPIKRVGFYAPGGKALYPSSVLMNVIPALVAGVEERVLVSPININKDTEILLAAAYLSEVTEFYRMGGAHTIAALSFGTKTINKVDKIVGPGNAYVAEAKRQVFGQVGIDAVAGPSEVLILCDNSCNPEWIAIDLLSQAEHDENAQSILISDDLKIAEQVLNEIDKILPTLKRRDIALKSWYKNGIIIIVDKIEQSIDLINKIAPEHLELCVNSPKSYLKDIKNAGSIFLGHFTPEAIGDYIAGPNHVLPTGGTARFSSGLGTLDFLRRTTFVQCNRLNLNTLGKQASLIADAEGLDAHKRSIEIRNKQ